MALCLCRQCKREYDHTKSRANWQGYCTRGCEVKKLKSLGWKKDDREWDFLNRAKALGSWPVVCQQIEDAAAVQHRIQKQRFIFNIHKDRLEGIELPENPAIERKWMRLGSEGYRECDMEKADILRLEVRQPQ